MGRENPLKGGDLVLSPPPLLPMRLIFHITHLPGGMTSSVRRDAAMGAMQLQCMSYLTPSLASVLPRPTMPNLAI